MMRDERGGYIQMHVAISQQVNLNLKFAQNIRNFLKKNRTSKLNLKTEPQNRTSNPNLKTEPQKTEPQNQTSKSNLKTEPQNRTSKPNLKTEPQKPNL